MTRTRTVLSAAALALALAGCESVMYDSNVEGPVAARAAEEPPVAGGTVAACMAQSLRWVLDRYPPPADAAPDSWVAINLPIGVTREQYIDVALMSGDRVAPMQQGLEHLPTYHVGWVWVRGDKARVDVTRPVYVLTSDDRQVYQTTTLHMKRHFASWRVERTQPWGADIVVTPAPNYIPPEPEKPGVIVAEPPSPDTAPETAPSEAGEPEAAAESTDQTQG